MIKEFCAENFTNIPIAIENGASRIELCDNLAVGGTTPSYGVIEATVNYGQENDVKIMTMIRPRGGNFKYSEQEFSMMRTDLKMAKILGTNGVVFGCLNDDSWLGESSLKILISDAADLEITFHMAFDQIDKERQFAAIDWLIDHGVKRILTHGGAAGTSICDNYAHLQKLIEYAADRIIILPGGGINYTNAEEIAGKLSVNEVHGTKIVNYSTAIDKL